MQIPQAPPSPRHDVPCTFMIPSLHDGVELECRIHHPMEVKSSRGAIIAHPYGPLGGSFDDAVVQSSISTLSSEGHIVGTFNFRGVGASKGRTSWSGKAEVADYSTFIAFFLLYLGYFQKNIEPDTLSRIEGGGSDHGPDNKSSDVSWALVLGGYSYGALATIDLPPLGEILDWCKGARGGSITSQLEQKAQHQAETHRTSSATKLVEIEGLRSSLPKVSYFLVSPLLPPLSWAIALPIPKISFRLHHGQDSETAITGSIQASKKLVQYPTLAVYSDNDQFTGIKKLRKWSADLHSHDDSQFRCFEVAGAGHFWQGEGHLEALQDRLRAWLRS